MPLVTAGYNSVCDGLAAVVTHVSLHTGDPSTTGANESTGGSPAYARKAVTWAAASGGTRANSGALTFDLPASTVQHVGFWGALTAGTFYGYFPLGGFAAMEATIAITSGVATNYAHGLVNTNQVLMYDVLAGGVPTGYTEGTIYFVTNATTDTFTLAATSGGATIAPSTAGEVVIQRVLPETFAAQGQYQINASNLILDGRFV